MFKKKIKLPTTLAEFDTLVDKVVKKYKLEDKHHAAAIISVAIRHLPNEQAYSTLDYLGQYVLKNLANFVANHKGQVLQQKSQIDALVNILANDPNDNQARDQLYLASQESEYAKEQFEKLEAKATVIAG